jgi:FkbM family methyltransferase
MYRVADDTASFVALLKAADPRASQTRDVIEVVRMREVPGMGLQIRRGTTDPEVAVSTFLGRFHVPPVGVRDPEIVWDLGANIGLTMAHMATVFPTARIIGVELDPSNASLARRNVRRWGTRCEVINAAVWPDDGEVHFESYPGQEDGAAVASSGHQTATAISLDSLCLRVGAADFVKMDVEGAEAELLTRGTRWADEVRCLAVECHPPYSVEQGLRDLAALGFSAYPLRQTWRRRARDCAVGVR